MYYFVYDYLRLGERKKGAERFNLSAPSRLMGLSKSVPMYAY